MTITLKSAADAGYHGVALVEQIVLDKTPQGCMIKRERMHFKSHGSHLERFMIHASSNSFPELRSLASVATRDTAFKMPGGVVGVEDMTRRQKLERC